MVRFFQGQPYVINPAMTNRERMARLAEALYGPYWRRKAARTMGCKRMTALRWAGAFGPDLGPPEEAVAELLKAARHKVRELELAIAEARLPPWMP